MTKIKYYIFILITLTLFSACSNLRRTNYKLVLDDDNIWVEQFDSTYKDPNRYTSNNKIFETNKTFVYSFEHIKKDGTSWSFQYIDSISDWKFVPLTSFEEKIEKVSISVLEGLKPMIYAIPDYNQTVLSYTYWTQNNIAPFGGNSGVIENERNIWMHPPRDKYFKILEISPFPYIKSPYKVGNSWNWSLEIGEYWSDPRWKTWKGTITNNYSYKIVDLRTIKTPLGKIKCYVVEGVAESEIGKTKLISFFSPEFGFVKLNYQNIDDTRTNLEIVKITAAKP